MRSNAKPRFNLTQQFGVLSLSCIAFIGVISAYTLSNLILSRVATLSQEFIGSIIDSERTWELFMDDAGN